MSDEVDSENNLKLKILGDVQKDQNTIDLKQMLSGEIFYSASSDQEESFDEKDLVELVPVGITFSTDPQNPFLLLKDKKQELTLPVAMTPIEAGVALTQAPKNATPRSLHRFTDELLKSLDIEIKRCVFVQIKGLNLFVRIYFTGHPRMNSLKVRADEAISLCLHFSTPLFATRAFINKSRLLSAQIEGLNAGLIKNQKLLNKNHPYLM